MLTWTAVGRNDHAKVRLRLARRRWTTSRGLVLCAAAFRSSQAKSVIAGEPVFDNLAHGDDL